MSVHIHLHRRGRSRNKKSDDENLERNLPDSMLFRRLLKYVFRYIILKKRVIMLLKWSKKRCKKLKKTQLAK